MAQTEKRRRWWIVLVAVLGLLTVGLWFFPVFMVRRGEQLNYERTAIHSLQLLHEAQRQYRTGHGGYASSLGQLAIPEDLAKGARFGYHFRLTAEANNYRLYATPTTFGTTGRRCFYSDATLIIRENWGKEPASATSPEIR